MNKETKTLLITIGVALGILWLFRPKLKAKDSSDLLDVKYGEPSVATKDDVSAKENATIGLQAMKDAIAGKESKKELDKLNAMILQDYGVKILVNKKTGKLRAMDKNGKVVAEEE